MMKTVGGRPVTNSGVLHFIGDEVAEVVWTPYLRFRSSTTSPPNAVTPTTEGDVFVLNVNVAPGATFSGFMTAKIADAVYRVTFNVGRLTELPAGALYEVSYTVTN